MVVPRINSESPGTQPAPASQPPRCAKRIQQMPSFEMALTLAREVHRAQAERQRRGCDPRIAQAGQAAEARAAAAQRAIELHQAATAAMRTALAATYRKEGLTNHAAALLTGEYILLLKDEDGS